MLEDLLYFSAEGDELEVFVVRVSRVEVLGDVVGGKVVDFAGINTAVDNRWREHRRPSLRRTTTSAAAASSAHISV